MRAVSLKDTEERFGCQDERRVELRRLIAARRCLDSARLSLVPGSNQLEDHTRWTGPRQALVFSSPFPSEQEASIKAVATVSFGCVRVCVFVAPV